MRLKYYGIFFFSLPPEKVCLEMLQTLSPDYSYLASLQRILSEGSKRTDRTGVGTISMFGLVTQYNLSHQCFPLLRSKRLSFHNIKHELIWFLRGETNIKYLLDNNVHIWDEWADSQGELGPVYGKQWRDWQGIDQIEVIEHQLRRDPFSRRIILSAWNVYDLCRMKLPPCHMMCQFYVRVSPSGTRYLDCQMYQRSADFFLGVPYNIASYGLLVELLCYVHDFLPGRLIHVVGDAHIYLNHLDQVNEQISRAGKLGTQYPKLSLDSPKLLKATSILDMIDHAKDISIIDYDPLPAIKAPIAV